MLLSFCDSLKESVDKYRWYELLPLVQFGMNCRINSITKVTPFFLMFGRNPFNYNGEAKQFYNDEDASERKAFWEAFNEAMPKAIYDLRKNKFLLTHYPHHTGEFKVGEHVMKERAERKSKNEPKFEGPYKVVAVLENGHYLISQEGKEKLEVPTNMLKRFILEDTAAEKEADDTSINLLSKVSSDPVVPASKPLVDHNNAPASASNGKKPSYWKQAPKHSKRTGGRITAPEVLRAMESSKGVDDEADESYSISQNSSGGSGVRTGKGVKSKFD